MAADVVAVGCIVGAGWGVVYGRVHSGILDLFVYTKETVSHRILIRSSAVQLGDVNKACGTTFFKWGSV